MGSQPETKTETCREDQNIKLLIFCPEL